MAVIQLYIQTFSLFKPKMQILSTLIRSTTFLLASVSGYLKVVKANAERLSDVKDDMKVFLEGCVKSLAWFEGMTAYKLMKVKEDPVDADKDKKPPKDSQYDMIIQSNLLAGGLQTRFLNFFSGESQT